MSIHYGNSTQEQRSHVESVIYRSVHCQSLLVECLMNLDNHDLHGFSVEDVENLFEHKCPECGETAEMGATDWCPDCNVVIRGEGDGKRRCDCDPEEDHDLQWNCDDEAWHCTSCDWASDKEPDTDPVEVYEWYLITDSWVADKLKDMGQPMLDNDYGTWWGRTCTGQAIALDPTFWTICQAYLPKE